MRHLFCFGRFAFVDRGDVRIDRLLFSFELLGDGGDDFLPLDADELRDDADVNHVRQQLAKARVRGQLAGQLRERHFVEFDVLTNALAIQRCVVDAERAGLQGFDVLARGLRIHAHHQIDFFFARDPAVLVRANREPRRQTSDVRWKHVLAADRNAHLKNRAHQHVVRRLRTRAVDRGHVNRQIIDDRLSPLGNLVENGRRCESIGHFGSPYLQWRNILAVPSSECRVPSPTRSPLGTLHWALGTIMRPCSGRSGPASSPCW